MKKFVYSLFLVITAAMVLASCSTQLSTVSIEKRHYNKGYFVQMGKKYKSESASRDIKTSVAEPVRSTQVTSENNVSETVPVSETPVTGTIAVAKNKQAVSKNLTASAAKHSAPSNLKRNFTPNTLKELKELKAASKRMVFESKSHDNNNNRGLLWTIIVILLILWLISFLSGGWGLGGILHLLLVIALVLLILMLLGVI